MICFGLRIGDYIRGIMSLLNVVVGSKEAVGLPTSPFKQVGLCNI